MTARRAAVIFGTIGGVGWIGKMLVMLAQGGPDEDSIVETIAFLMGLVGVPAAAAAAAVHLTKLRDLWMRVAAAVAALVVVGVAIGTLQWALTALPGDSWLQSEAVFGLLGATALVLAAAMATRRPRQDSNLRPTD